METEIHLVLPGRVPPFCPLVTSRCRVQEVRESEVLPRVDDTGPEEGSHRPNEWKTKSLRTWCTNRWTPVFRGSVSVVDWGRRRSSSTRCRGVRVMSGCLEQVCREYSEGDQKQPDPFTAQETDVLTPSFSRFSTETPNKKGVPCKENPFPSVDVPTIDMGVRSRTDTRLRVYSLGRLRFPSSSRPDWTLPKDIWGWSQSPLPPRPPMSPVHLDSTLHGCHWE